MCDVAVRLITYTGAVFEGKKKKAINYYESRKRAYDYCFRIRTGFDEDSLEWLEQLFRQTVGNEKEIRRDDFKKILITKNVSLTLRMRKVRLRKVCAS